MEHVNESGDQRWLGQPVIDENSKPIGKVVDVLYDDDTSRSPQWAVVGVGMLKTGHYLPLRDAYRTADGRLVVPYDQQTVKRAPKAARNHVLTPDVRQATTSHYGL